MITFIAVFTKLLKQLLRVKGLQNKNILVMRFDVIDIFCNAWNYSDTWHFIELTVSRLHSNGDQFMSFIPLLPKAFKGFHGINVGNACNCITINH